MKESSGRSASSVRTAVGQQGELNPPRVGLYARVSTANGQQDPELQLSELREYAARRGWEIAEIYTDNGVSGSKDSRPALNRLMADAGQRKFDTVLVWKLDRFGRSLRHLINALAELEARGIAFVSLRDTAASDSAETSCLFVRVAVAFFLGIVRSMLGDISLRPANSTIAKATMEGHITSGQKTALAAGGGR